MQYQQKLEEKFEFNEPRMAAKQGRKTCHTGPKGVITDFEEAKLKMRAFRIEDKIKRESKKYMSFGNASNETAQKLTIIDSKAAKPTKKQLRREHPIKSESKSQEAIDDDDLDSDDLFDDDAEEDEEALLRYKMQKMQILRDNQARYGNTMELTAWTFEKEVDQAPKNVFVVVHVYQDYMERCARMNYAIARIAKSYPHIKFLRARSDRLGLDTYPEIGLPTFIVFKNGQQLQNHIAVHELIGCPFEVKDVEAFLIKNKVIEPVVVIPDIGANDEENEKKQVYGNKMRNLKVRNNASIGFSNQCNEDDSESE